MIPLLSSIPFLANAVSFFSKKKRLVLEYALIAVIVTVAGFTFTLWLSKIRTERDLANTQLELIGVQSRLTTIESINVTQKEEIAALGKLRAVDAQALGGLLADYKELASSDAAVRDRLKNLENSNEAVRNYLSQPIPPELVCMLNESCPAGADSNHKD